ncbi:MULTISPECIES: M20 family metallopeptidase [Pseudomonas]|jgi:glutamate carboxypeptidase|nr:MULTISPECIES: M20 family metallopeptidase [Pseudomonas]ARD10034.1 peptidase M20 [Pseudomonas savastanoi pv. savastanoi NCPPB 3335]KAA3532836.1 M20 family peptidase [Pseudomonas savastanoi]KPB27255.1 putative deacylase [Pseudomonas syringae pv. syringae]KUG42961.1 putative deacylase [Pseudomonas savastanoi pv. fraxini]KWS80624.1 peptidase M20 [Pseudomonas savastanoi pv. fraxini]
MKKAYYLLLAAFIAQHTMAGQSADEKKLVTYVDQHHAEQVSFLETLVNINSGTENVKGVTQVGNLMKQKLDELGFETQWHALPAGMNHAGSLVAVHKGKSPKRMLLIGHLDTVFPEESKFQKFTYIEEGKKAKGPGVIDDKGGMVTMLYALQALKANGSLENMNIAVVLVGDEELAARPTDISRKVLTDEAKKSDVALGFEFALSANQLVTNRRGLSEWFLTSKGVEQHSAKIFQPITGFGAIYESARVLDQIRSQLSNTPGLTINPGIALGGASASEYIENGKGVATGRKTSVAAASLVHGDLRFASDDQKALAESKIKAIVSNPLANTSSEFVLKPIMPVMEETKGNLELLKQYSEVSQDLAGPALEPVPSAERGGADISYISKFVNASLDGLGAAGDATHTENEIIDLSSLVVATKRAAIFMSRYSE